MNVGNSVLRLFSRTLARRTRKTFASGPERRMSACSYPETRGHFLPVRWRSVLVMVFPPMPVKKSLPFEVRARKSAIRL